MNNTEGRVWVHLGVLSSPQAHELLQSFWDHKSIYVPEFCASGCNTHLPSHKHVWSRSGGDSADRFSLITAVHQYKGAMFGEGTVWLLYFHARCRWTQTISQVNPLLADYSPQSWPVVTEQNFTTSIRTRPACRETFWTLFAIERWTVACIIYRCQ